MKLKENVFRFTTNKANYFNLKLSNVHTYYPYI